MLQLPSHVQALRCMGIGRLWDGDHGREAMPHLMGYIMEYCRKPTITLDCPKEDILLDHTFCESFFFNDNGNLYSVLKRGREIMLRCISASSCCSVPPPVNIPLCFNATEAPWTCFYEDRSRLLYILYNRSVLLKYDMKAQKGGTSIHFPHVPRSSLNNNQSGTGKKGPTIMVVGSSFYIGIVSRHESLGHSAVRYHFNIFCAKLTRTSEMRLIFSDSLVSPIHVHDPSSLLTFLYSSPHGIAIRYTSDHTMHTVTLEMLRTENPVLFSEKREETLQRCAFSQRTGLHIPNDSPYYTLYHPLTLKRRATLHRGEETLPAGSMVSCDRWTIWHTKNMNAGGTYLRRYHPYVL